MLIRAIAAAAVLLLATTGTFADPVPEPVSPVVRIDDGCTGFSIGPSPDGVGTRIVTAGHCIKKFDGFKVELSDGSVISGMLVMWSNPRRADDMAIIQVSVNIPAVKISCGPAPIVGVKVHITGYPGYYGLATVWGNVAGKAAGFKDAWRDALPINVSVAPGYSGAPVMTEDGHVVGILVGGLTANMSLAFASPAYRLCELIGRDWMPS
jgi:S1-C subfamily serine protease